MILLVLDSAAEDHPVCRAAGAAGDERQSRPLELVGGRVAQLADGLDDVQTV